MGPNPCTVSTAHVQWLCPADSRVRLAGFAAGQRELARSDPDDEAVISEGEPDGRVQAFGCVWVEQALKDSIRESVPICASWRIDGERLLQRPS